MRTFLIILLLITVLRIHAQAPEAHVQAARFWVGAQASPDHAHRTLVITEPTPATGVIRDARER